MAPLTGVFFDTSILVAGMVDLGESSVPALAVIDAVADGRILAPSTSWHNCLEFFSVTTRLPEEYRLPSDVALRFVREEILGRFSVHDLEPAARDRFLLSAVANGVAGGRIYDAHIAEVARTSGARIVVTENRRHFRSLHAQGVRVLSAAELADELAPT
jgi:predicted nucleic acid-binding protein